MEVTLNMFQTFALAAIFYCVGVFLKKHITPLRRYCVPEPAIGGLIFALLTLFLHQTGIMTVSMDTTLQTVCMYIFFSAIGFAARLTLLVKSGKKLIIVFVLCVTLMLLQNVLGVGVMALFGKNKLLGLCVGAMSMIGGHGTSAAWGDVVANAGAPTAMTVALAAATFGVVAGGMFGGPTAEKLIVNHKLKTGAEAEAESDVQQEAEPVIKSDRFMRAAVLMILCVVPGQWLSQLISKHLFTFPIPVSITVIACLVRTVCDLRHMELPEVEIDTIGSVMLGLFLTCSMMSIQLWQLADLALPMIVALVLQVVLTVGFSYFIVFRLAGRDYEAAVMASGVIGFGLGATPNALANMNSVRQRFGPAPQAFIIIPLLGTLFIDLAISVVMTIMINILA